MSILLSPCCVLGAGLGLAVGQVVLLCQETGSQGIGLAHSQLQAEMHRAC